jgi:hypothetical protein
MNNAQAATKTKKLTKPATMVINGVEIKGTLEQVGLAYLFARNRQDDDDVLIIVYGPSGFFEGKQIAKSQT